MAKFRFLQLMTILLFIFLALAQSEEVINSSRKLQEGPPNLENKCGRCPCNNPCLPPPPPPPPSPPPPKAKPPPSNNCPPPPSGGGSGQYTPNPPYIFINGPPGNLYPVDPYYSGSARSFSAGSMPFLISFVLGVVAFW